MMDPLKLPQQHQSLVTLESLQALPPTGQLILIILYSATAMASFLGNSLVLLVLLFGSKLRRYSATTTITTTISTDSDFHYCSTNNDSDDRNGNGSGNGSGSGSGSGNADGNGSIYSNNLKQHESLNVSIRDHHHHHHYSLIKIMRNNDNNKKQNHFLINLALADLAMSLFSIPFTYTDFMLGRWIFPSIFCRLASTINVLAITVSVYTLVLISVDRFV